MAASTSKHKGMAVWMDTVSSGHSACMVTVNGINMSRYTSE
jgi:hypothetical protein